MMVNTNLHTVSSIFTSLYQGNMAMFNNRMNRSLFPRQSNMASQGFPQLNFGDAQYITNIRESSSALSSALSELTGAASDASTITSSNDDVISDVSDESRPSNINATLRQASDEEIGIAFGQDRSDIRNTINDMVRSYNNLFTAAAENTNDPRAQGLATRLLNTSRVYTRGLNEIGITFDNSGRMRIDNQRMNEAMESGRLETFFTENAGRSYGFTNQLERLADNVSRNPANFATNSLFGGNLSGNFGYSGFGNLMHFNSLAAGSLMNFLL